MIEYPDDEDMLLLLAFALNTQGQFEESLRIFDMIGMPQVAMHESRRANEVHHLPSMIAALQGVGRNDEATELLAWDGDLNRRMTRDNGSWAPWISGACLESLRGNREAALTMLEKLPSLPTLVWMPYLRDLTCMQPLKNDPRYIAVVDAMEQRIAKARAELPNALQRHGLMSVIPTQK